MTATGTNQLGVRLTVPDKKRSNRAPVTMQGWLYKQGSEGLMLWKKRWFVLSEYCLFYYKNSNEEKVLGSILLPSYKISPCSTAEGNLFKKKFSFKAEHANVRTYYFAADSKDEMIRWMNAMSLATIAQEHRVIEFSNCRENRPQVSQSTNDTNISTNCASKTYDYQQRIGRENMLGNDNHGVKSMQVSVTQPVANNQPLYVNAPPKPRRYNETPCGDRTYSSGNSEMENFVLAHTAYPIPNKYTFRNDESSWPARKRAISTSSSHQADKENNEQSNNYNSTVRPSSLYSDAIQKPYSHQSNKSACLDNHHNDEDEDRQFFNKLNWSNNHELSTPYLHGRASSERPRSVDIFLQPSCRSDTPQQPAPATHQTTNKSQMQWLERKNVLGNSNQRDAAKHANVKNAQPLPPPRPKSSIDIVSSDHFHWSAEQYAQNMRKSAQFLVSKTRQLPFAAGTGVTSASASPGYNVSSKNRDADIESVATTVMTTVSSNDRSSQSHYNVPSPVITRKLSPSGRYIIGSGISPTGMPTNRSVNDFVRSKSARLAREKQYTCEEYNKDCQSIRNSNRQNITNYNSAAATRTHSSSHSFDQREESMKRLLEWKQRMLQSPLTRKSTSSRVEDVEIPTQRRTIQNTPTNKTNVVDKLGNARLNIAENQFSNHIGDSFNHGSDLLMTHNDIQFSPSRHVVSNKDQLSCTSKLLFDEDFQDSTSTANSKANQSKHSLHTLDKPHSTPLLESGTFSPNSNIAATNARYSFPYKTLNDAGNSIVSESDTLDCSSNYKSNKSTPVVTTTNEDVHKLPRQNLVQDRIKVFERIPSSGNGKIPTETITSIGSKTTTVPIASSVPTFTSLSSTLSRTIPLANLAAYNDLTITDSTDKLSDKMSAVMIQQHKNDSTSSAESTTMLTKQNKTSPTKTSSTSLNSKGIYLGTLDRKIETIDSNNVTPMAPIYQTLPKASSSLSTNRRLMEVNEPGQSSSIEDHYLPMAPSKKPVFNSTNDLFYHTRSNSASSASQIMILETLLSEDNENSYVEMTVGDDRSSVGSAIDKSNSSLASTNSHTLPKVTSASNQKLDNQSDPICSNTATDKSHYEFLYRASSSMSSLSSPLTPQLLEPLYMEVSSIKESSISTIKNDSGDAASKIMHSIIPENEDSQAVNPIVLPDILNTSNMNQLHINNLDSNDDINISGSVDKEMYPINMPAHPRFSLSDTFRPASYYLGGSCTTGVRNTLGLCFDQPDSSDSDLVSPPPIPATVPLSQLDDLNVSLDTVRSDNETSILSPLHPPFLYSIASAGPTSIKDYKINKLDNTNTVNERVFHPDEIASLQKDLLQGEYKQPPVDIEGENIVFQLRNHFKNDVHNTLTAPYYYADLLKASDNGGSSKMAICGETIVDGKTTVNELDNLSGKKCQNQQLQQQQQLSNTVNAILNNKRFAASATNLETAIGAPIIDNILANGSANDGEATMGSPNHFCYNHSNSDCKQNNAVGQNVNRLSNDHLLSKNLLDQRASEFDSVTAAAAAAATVATSSKTIDQKNIYNSVVFQNKFSSSKYDLAAIAQAPTVSCTDVARMERTHVNAEAVTSTRCSSLAAYRRRSQSFDGLLDQVTKYPYACEDERSNYMSEHGSTIENNVQLQIKPTSSGNLRQARSLDNLDKNIASSEFEAVSNAKDDINTLYTDHRIGGQGQDENASSMERRKLTKQISRDVTYVNDSVFTQMKKVKQSFKEYTEDYREIRRIKRYSRPPGLAVNGNHEENTAVAEHQRRVLQQRRGDDGSGDNDAYYERLDPRATIWNSDTSCQLGIGTASNKSQPYLTNSCSGDTIGPNLSSGLVTTVASMLTASKMVDNNCSSRFGTTTTTNTSNHGTVAVIPSTMTNMSNNQTLHSDSVNSSGVTTITQESSNKIACDDTIKEHGKNNTQPKSGAQSFLEEGVYPTKPPSSFEIDREKLRQWDLMSSAPVAMLDAIQKYPLLETLASQTNHQQQQQLSQLRANIIQMTDNISNSIALTNSPVLDLNCANGPDQMLRANHAPVLPNLLSPVTRNKDECRLEMVNRTNKLDEMNSNVIARQLSNGSPDLVRVINAEENVRPNMTTAMDGEATGNTHEELILLLIKLRRQNVNIYKAIESCHLEIERQARSIQMEKLNKVTDINKLKELKSHLNDLEKQYEKGKPLVNLVDNMVKLGSLYKHYLPSNLSPKKLNSNGVDSSIAEKIKFNDAIQEQRLLDEEHKEWQRVNADDGQLQAKIEELFKLDQELQRESTLLQNLKQDKDLLEYALGGLKSKIRDTFRNSQEMEKYTRQQSVLENELGHVRSVLAKNSQKLEEMVTTNARLENELTILRQKLRTQLNSENGGGGQQRTAAIYNDNCNMAAAAASITSNNTPGVVRALENELKRVQMIVGNLQRQRNELECQVRQLTEKSKNLYHRTENTGTVGSSSIMATTTTTAAKIPSTNRFENSIDVEDRWFESQLDLDDSSSTVEPILGIASSDSRQQNQHLYAYCDEDGELNDQLDNKTKQFYGIIPREKCQEIKTVRIVKRESERRHKDRDRCCNNIGIPVCIVNTSIKRPSNAIGRDENLNDNFVATQNTQMGGVVDHLSSANDDCNENTLIECKDLLRSNNRRHETSTANESNTNKTSSILEMENENENASSRLSPVLYQSNAAKEIVRELVLSKGDTKMINNNARKTNNDVRKVGAREKRRHHTISHSKPIPFLQNYRNDIRSRDDVDLERELRGPRLNTTPDIVKSTLHKTDSIKYDSETIDSLFGRPKKISIPERYVPENVPELSAEEQNKRLKKTEAIRKMLSQTSAIEATSTAAATSPTADLVEDENGQEMDDERNEGRTQNKISTNKLEENKRERDYILQLNQILAQQVMEKSKLVAGTKKS